MLKLYTPRDCVSAAELEAQSGCPGEWSGLLVERLTTCGSDEDTVSMALTVVHQLIDRYGLRSGSVGLLEVSSESLVDRSKSMKTELMSLLEMRGSADVEGVSVYQACDSGATALLDGCRWCDSTSWDGRWALAVSSEVSLAAAARRSGVAPAVALAALIGPDAPLRLGPSLTRQVIPGFNVPLSVGWHGQVAVVDGPGAGDVHELSASQAMLAFAELSGFSVAGELHDRAVYDGAGGPALALRASEESAFRVRCSSAVVRFRVTHNGRPTPCTFRRCTADSVHRVWHRCARGLRDRRLQGAGCRQASARCARQRWRSAWRRRC